MVIAYDETEACTPSALILAIVTLLDERGVKQTWRKGESSGRRYKKLARAACFPDRAYWFQGELARAVVE